MTPEERSDFLRSHRLCVVSYARRSGPPAMTPVYYVMEGDDILISTTRSRAKAKVLQRNSEVSVCVLGEQQPFPYLTVYGTGSIEADGAADLMRRVGEKIGGNPIPDAAMPAIEKRAQDEGRVVMRVRPRAFTP